MGSMNAGIILAGQQPNLLAAVSNANTAAAQQNQFQRTRDLNALYKDQGAQIAAGDQNALNALAGFDPNAALGVQGARQGLEAGALSMDATRQNMQVQLQTQARLSREEERQVQAHAAKMNAAERAQEAAQIERGVAQALGARTAQEFDAIVAQFDPTLVGQFGNRDVIAGKYMSVADMLKRADERAAPPETDYIIQDGQYIDRNDPQGGARAVPGLRPPETEPADEYQRYVQEERGTGRQPLSRIDFAKAKRDKGTVVYDPTTGKPLVSIGGGGNDPTDVANPSSPAAMIASIDGILNDPALDSSTGILSPLQNVPGTAQRRVGARMKQLEGQAFLQAFESLKGAGQITEIEGAKATQAIGRLDSAQSPDDYRAALTELRDVLSLAAQRPVGWAEQQSSAPAKIPSIASEAEYNALPSGAIFMAPDGSQRRKP